MKIQLSNLPTRESTIFLILLGLLTAPGFAQAHHSWGAIYNGGEAVSINAVITGSPYRNPHDTVDVTIVNGQGEQEVWKIEWRSERGRGRGMGGAPAVEYDLNPGDEVVIDGRTARDPDRNTIQMTTLTRVSDGMTIQAREGRGGNRRNR